MVFELLANMLADDRPPDLKQATNLEDDVEYHQVVSAAIKIQYIFRRWKHHKRRKETKGLLQKMNTMELRKKLEERESSVMVARKKSSALPQYWTQSTKFNVVIGLVVMTNAITLGFEADYGLENPEPFMVLENVFCAVFTLELILHFGVEGYKVYFSDRMNWLDFFLVSFSVMDVWILQAAKIEADLKLMSVFRMLRLVRLARLLRLFRIFKELTLIVAGFVDSVRTLFWAVVFLLIVVYIFAIFARQIIGSAVVCTDGQDPCDEEDPASEAFYAFNPEIGDQMSLFGSVDKSMLTLFVCLTEGCGIDIIHPIVLKTPILITFWAIFVFFTTFGLLNLIVGIFCEHAMKTAAENEREILQSREEARRKTLNNLRDAFMAIDDDKSGSISKKEYISAITSNEKVMNAFIQLGLHEEENLFETLDADRAGNITFDQFFDGVMLIMKGHETAKAKDMVGVHLLCQSLARRCTTLLDDMKTLRKRQTTVSGELNQVRGQAHKVAEGIDSCHVALGNLSSDLAFIREELLGSDEGHLSHGGSPRRPHETKGRQMGQRSSEGFNNEGFGFVDQANLMKPILDENSSPNSNNGKCVCTGSK